MANFVPSRIRDIKGLTQALYGQGAGVQAGLQPVGTRSNGLVYNSTLVGGDLSVYSRCVRVQHYAPAGAQGLRFVYSNYRGTGNSVEQTAALTSPIVVKCALEYPLGTIWPMTFNNGAERFHVIQGEGAAVTDPVPVTIVPGDIYYERVFVTCANPPTTFAAVGSDSGGSLAAATYYYKITAVTNAGESGPAAEANSGARAGGSSSVALSWVANDLGVTVYRYNIYRSTSAGTEVYLTSVPGTQLSFTDTGAFTPGSATPPALGKWAGGINLGITANEQGVSNSDVVDSGSLGSQIFTQEFTSNASLGIPLTPIASFYNTGDSINVGFNGYGFAYGFGGDQGWFQRALGNAYPYINTGHLGEKLEDFQGVGRLGRLRLAAGCKYFFCNFFYNSVNNGRTLAQMQADAVNISKAAAYQGCIPYWVTAPPHTTSDNGWLTADHQTVIPTVSGGGLTWEQLRLAWNAWLRASASAGAGNSYLYDCGGAAAGIIDVAAQIEVNSANVLTLNGGFWKAGSVISTGTATTGGTTIALFDTGASFSNAADQGTMVQWTDGTGLQYATIASVTGSTKLNLGATVARAPANGQAYTVYGGRTQDGTHPNGIGYIDMAAAFNPALFLP